ncbi:ribonuclease H-like domain-containing protein [Tanacetum coccineum]
MQPTGFSEPHLVPSTITLSTYPMLTHSRDDNTRPTQYFTLNISTISPLLKTYTQDVIKNNTWVLVPLPSDVNVVRSMWLIRHKFIVDASLSRYKALLVANGGTQLQGIYVDDTFSLVVKPTTILMVLSIAIS